MKQRKFLIKNLSIIDGLNITFLIVNLALWAIAFKRTPYRYQLLAIYLLLFCLIFFIRWLRDKVRNLFLTRLIALIYPLIFLFTIFETFFMLLPYFNSYRFDDLMTRIDQALLGVHPTVWLERFMHPMLTEILHIAYVFYFFMPVIIFIWALWGSKYKLFEKFMFMYLFCEYGAFLLYFFVPVAGPRFHLQGLQMKTIEGILVTGGIRNLIDILEPNKLDAFPSLHAAVVLVVMLLSFTYIRKIFYLFLPWAIAIFISLVYCRYHYFVDVIAGIVWAALCWITVNGLFRRYYSCFTQWPHQAKPSHSEVM